MQLSSQTVPDLLSRLQQSCTQIAAATSFEEAIAACDHVLNQHFHADRLALIWHQDDMWKPLYGFSENTLVSEEPPELLRSGQIVITEQDEQSYKVLAPLRSGEQLLGWLDFNSSVWLDNSKTVLNIIANQVASTLAMFDNIRTRQSAHFETLSAISQHISSQLDLGTLLDTIYEAIDRVIHVKHLYITLINPISNHLELVYHVDDGVRQHIETPILLSADLKNIVLQERRVITAQHYLEECKRYGVEPCSTILTPRDCTWLGVPLIVRDQAIGVLVICKQSQTKTYSEEEIALISAITSQAAIAIENARLYQRSERQALQLGTLNRIGRTITSWLDPDQVPTVIMEQVTRLLNVEEGSLLLLDHDTDEMVFTYTTGPVGQKLLGQRLKLDAGLAGYVYSSGQTVIVNDVQSDTRFDGSTDETTGYTTRSMLAVPLRAVGGVQGVIEVMNRRDSMPFTQDDQRLLEALSDYAVIALENAQRFAQVDKALARRAQELAITNDRLEHNLHSLTSLNAFGRAIYTSLRSANEIYTMTARGVMELNNALGAWIFLQHGQEWDAPVALGPTLRMNAELQSLLSEVLAQDTPQVFFDRPAQLQAIGCYTLLVVPLRATQSVLGCLCVGYAERLATAPDLETVNLFATQAASAVESLSLFQDVRSAHDQMLSVLESTREGMVLIDGDGHVAIANNRLFELTGLSDDLLTPNLPLSQFFERWASVALYAPGEMARLQKEMYRVLQHDDPYITGELNDQDQHQVLEYIVLNALSSGDSHGGVLLVMRDITETKESERLRQDLTNMIVHDLRSPLSSVMAAVEMMTRGVTGELNQRQRHVLQIADVNAHQMLAMINNLLDISRLEAGRMPLTLALADLGGILDSVTTQMQSLAQDRSVTLRVGKTPYLSEVNVDASLIARVIQNLITNALKFSHRGGYIDVQAEHLAQYDTLMAGLGFDKESYPGLPAAIEELLSNQEMSQQSVIIGVRDYGIGIAPRDREKIFAKFEQIGERRSGTGLGLTFCKLVVEAHGGLIWVTSALGQGSTFFFTLPVASRST